MTVWHGFMTTPDLEDGVNMIAETATEIEYCFRTILEIHNASYKRVREEDNTIVYYVWWDEAIDDSDEEFTIEPYTLGLNKWYIDRENNEE